MTRIEPSDRPVRIANISGFYGDRSSAAREVVAGPDPVDVLTGDYLAELTMLILHKARAKQPSAGYATTFLTQLEGVLGNAADRGIRVVSNAGGLNPHGLAEAVRQLAEQLGIAVSVAAIDGDDLLARLPDLLDAGHELRHLDRGTPLGDRATRAVTTNAYLGGWGIADALGQGADIVICPRVTDASLAVGPAAWWHGWQRHDWDAIAGAMAAGHVIECGPQATGGNYCFPEELPDARLPGFPIAEVERDGCSVITKQPGSGGAVTIGTVTAQLLYEIGEPAYAGPDAIARFDALELAQEGPDRVRIAHARGEPPSGQLKVALTFDGGYRNTMTMAITGLDRRAKADHALAQLWEGVGGTEQFERIDVQLRDLPQTDDGGIGEAHLRVTVFADDAAVVGRRFSNAVTALALSSYAGFYTTTPPTAATAYGVYWPTLVPAELVTQRVHLADGTIRRIPSTATAPSRRWEAPPAPAHTDGGPTDVVPLGLVCGARSGDKGGNANVGVWTRDDVSYAWLHDHLTVDVLRQLLPEAADLQIDRYALPTLRALNFVIVGLLGDGVAANARTDPQAKALGERLRAGIVPVPRALLGVRPGGSGQHGSS